MKGMMIGLLLATFATNSFAYYNPGQGRWLSRDPIHEPGFTVATTGRQPASAADADEQEPGSPTKPNPTKPNELNPYGFVLNDPQNRIDELGLISFSKSCTDAQRAELTAAWNKACQLVNDPGYQCCLNRPGLTQLLKRRCSWGNIKFTCNNNQSGICGITMGGTITTCAHSFRSLAIGRGEIVICYPGVYACGNVSCTMLHEMGHVLGRPFHTGPVNDNRPDSLANCCFQHIR
jgi:hypothetical protein